MKLSEMNVQVKFELSAFDPGRPDSAQRLFRAVYQMRRMNSLGRTPEEPGESSEDVRDWSVAYVRRTTDPDFEPLARQ